MKWKMVFSCVVGHLRVFGKICWGAGSRHWWGFCWWNCSECRKRVRRKGELEGCCSHKMPVTHACNLSISPSSCDCLSTLQATSWSFLHVPDHYLCPHGARVSLYTSAIAPWETASIVWGVLSGLRCQESSQLHQLAPPFLFQSMFPRAPKQLIFNRWGGRI